MDPRLGAKGFQKRVASRSPEGIQAPKQIRPSNPNDPRLNRNNRQSSIDSRRQSVEVSSGHSTPMSAPTAPMANGSASSSVVDVLMNFTKNAADIGTVQHAMKQSEARLTKVLADHKVQSKHFAGFPSIKEQQENKKTIAEKEFNDLERHFNQQMAAQRKVAESIAALIEAEKPTRASNPAPQSDGKLAQEFAQMSARVEKLENHFNSPDGLLAPKQLGQLKSIPKVMGFVPRLEKLEAGANASKTKLENLEKNHNLLDDQVYGDGDSSLSKSVFGLKCDMQRVKDGTLALPENDAGVEKRLKNLEGHTEWLLENEGMKDEAVINHVDSELNKKFTKFTSEKLKSLNERIDDAANREAVTAAFTEMDKQVKEARGKISKYEQQLEEASKGFEKGVLTLAKLRDDVNLKLDTSEGTKLRNEIDGLKEASRKANAAAANASRTATPAQGQQNGQRVASGPNGVNGSPALTNGVHPPNMNPAKATSPAYIQGHSGPISTVNMHPDVAEAIFGLISKHDSLTMVFRHIQTRIDNLTTDEVAKCMLDQFGNIWPYAKDFEHYCRNFDDRITGIQNHLNAMGDLVKYGEGMKTFSEKISGELEALTGKVKEVAERMVKGEAVMAGCEKALKEFT